MTDNRVTELREKAKLLRGHAEGLNAPYVIPSTKELMALTMLDSAGRMEEAADTIISLRNRLQQAEYAKALLSKSEARKIAHIDELEQLVRDMVALERARKYEDFMMSLELYGEIKERLEALGIEVEP
jgi:hypothetical protein